MIPLWEIDFEQTPTFATISNIRVRRCFPRIELMDGHSRKAKKALLLGLGLDNDDGHVRYTKGPNFHLFGGSENTHGEMQEKAIQFNEELKRRDKRLEDVGHQEFCDIADSVGLKLPDPPD
jgi:hypothetical protein